MFRFPPLTTVVKFFLGLFLASYVATLVAVNWLNAGHAVDMLPLSTGRLGIQTAWQLITYVLAHDAGPSGVTSFLIGAVFFWLVVAPFEQRFGAKRTAQAVFASALGGSIAALGIGLAFPGVLAGAWPMTLGVFAAHAWVMHRTGLEANFFGVMPMKPTTMIWIMLALGVLSFLASRSWLALAANFGATGAGILFVEWMSKPPKTEKKPPKRQNHIGLRVIDGGNDDKPKYLN